MKNEQEIVRSVFDAHIRELKAISAKEDRPVFDMLEEVKNRAIKALEIVEEFEKAQIITGGRLNGKTYAYKCGLEDGKRKALEQQSSEDCVSRKAVLDILSHYAHNFGADTEIKALSQVTPTHGTCKDCKYAEIHNGKLSEHCSVKCEPFCRKFLRFVSGENFYCADFEKRGNSDGSN